MSSYRYRHENKYLINAQDTALTKMRGDGILKKDSHVGPSGIYLVRSLYFDDMEDSCLRENLAGTDIRSKFRIRYYGDDTGRISLEKKSKKNGLCLKKSCVINMDEYEELFNGRMPRVSSDDEKAKIKTELFSELSLKCLKPKVIVTYERIPYTYSAGNVRITIDGHITSGYELDKFLTGDYEVRPVLNPGESVLEVKWDELLPLHIRKSMHIDEYNRTAFSKYYMCRRFHL